MDVPKVVSLRITDTKPEVLNMADLAEIIAGMDKAIRAMVSGGDAPDLTLGLVGIRPGSIVLEVASNRPETTSAAISDLATAVSARRPEVLPKAARVGLQQVLPVLRRNASDGRSPSIMMYCEDDPPERPKGILTSDMDFSYEPPPATGHTVLYGYLMWIGGENPKAHVKIDGRSLTCKLSRKLALTLANRLYQEVGLEGEAVWNTEDWTIIDFTITAVTPYAGGSILDAIDALSDAVGDGWKSVGDVNTEIARIRRESEPWS